jgi:hypothetical protein
MESPVSAIDSFRSVIALWPSVDAFAFDVGVRPPAARKWFQRDRIPSEWWGAVLSTQKARSAELSAQTFVEIAARNAAEASA